MSEREIIESACKCGEPVHVEVGGYSCRNDGKRPYHPGAADLTTQFRCRKCKEWLGYSCEAAAFADATPPTSHDAGEAVSRRNNAACEAEWEKMVRGAKDAIEEFNDMPDDRAILHAARTIATLTAEVSRLTGELAKECKQHRYTKMGAKEEAKRADKLKAELERRNQQFSTVVGSLQKKGIGLTADLERSRKECEGLREALIEVSATLAWLAHGECRAIHDGPIMPSAMAIEAAKAALSAGEKT